jgi:di/tricarboxylate transporter
MTPDAIITILVVLTVIGAASLTRIGIDLIMLAALTVLLTARVLTPAQALAGFANEGVITVGVLFVLAAGLRETGGMAWLAHRGLGRPKTVLGAQARLVVPIVAMSAFMNNTPLVATMLPVVHDWTRRLGLPPSKLFIHLSYAAILGGVCTLIGTSTNLVVHGLLIAHQEAKGRPPVGLHMFDLAPIGVPCAIVGIAYMLVASRFLLPDRRPAVSVAGDPREYTVEMLVEPGSAIAGKTIEEAGLRQLPGLFLVEIERGGEVLPAVGPQERLRGDDRLVFAGVVDSVVELRRIRGLRPATDQVLKVDAPPPARCLVEAVVSNSCRIVGQTIREGRFRTIYNAAVIAVARDGTRVRGKIGDIVLHPGDTLLLETHRSFAEQHRNSRDFYLVNRLADSTPPRHERAPLALAILVGMVVVAGAGWLSVLNAALIAGGLMILTRCVTASAARRQVDWQVLITIAAALGIGRAMDVSGAASTIVGAFVGLAGESPWMALAAVYLLAMLFTEVMSNNAAAALMFPLAMSLAGDLGVSETPFAIAVAIAASCGFATPLGYQTNLMVYGPGGYRFFDYLRFGGILNLIVAAVTIILTPLVFPF